MPLHFNFSNFTPIVLGLLFFAVISTTTHADSKAPGDLTITIKANGKSLDDKTLVPVQADFTHPDGKNGLAFEVTVKVDRDTTGPLTTLYLTNDPLIPVKSKRHTENKDWAYEAPGTMTNRADLKSGTTFNQTLVLWLDENVAQPYGQIIPVSLRIADSKGTLFSKTFSLVIPEKK